MWPPTRASLPLVFSWPASPVPTAALEFLCADCHTNSWPVPARRIKADDKRHTEMCALLLRSAPAAAPAPATSAPTTVSGYDRPLVATLTGAEFISWAATAVNDKLGQLVADSGIDGATFNELTVADLREVLGPALAARITIEIRKAYPPVP